MLVDGRRVIKARLTVRGFKDLQAHDLKTFAATASRWGQRAVAAMAAQMHWRLWSADVGQAFLRGLTIEEINRMPGEGAEYHVRQRLSLGSGNRRWAPRLRYCGPDVDVLRCGPGRGRCSGTSK